MREDQINVGSGKFDALARSHNLAGYALTLLQARVKSIRKWSLAEDSFILHLLFVHERPSPAQDLPTR